MTNPATLSSACPLDCPDGCTLQVEVDGSKVVRIDGDRRNPLTQGLICGKVRNFAKHLYGPDRLVTPGIRIGAKGEGKFRAVGWDEALDTIAGRIRDTVSTFGGPSVLPFAYGGSNGLLSDGSLDERLFRRLNASTLRRTACAAPSGRAYDGLYARMPGVPLTDYEHAKLIVLWGVNPSATSIHLVPLVHAARERGAKLVVVDPRTTPLAAKADLHLPVRPGTDLIVALAVMDWLWRNDRHDAEFLDAHTTGAEQLRTRAARWPIDKASAEAGLDPARLEEFARLFADSSPAVVRCGWGPERNRNGGSATAAILALPAVAGKFGVVGGGLSMSESKFFRLDTSKAVAAAPASTRVINMVQLGKALTELDDPPIKVLFSYNCNPWATMPNQALVTRGLEREDLFTVVFDQVMTDSARYADVILPATTFLEHDELAVSYGTGVLNHSRAAVSPPGEARSNVSVFGALLERLELDQPGDPKTDDALVEAIIGASELPAETTAALQSIGSAAPKGQRVLFGDVFPRTADQKIHFCPPALDAETPHGLYTYQPDPDDGSYPLALISPAIAKQVSSTFGQLLRGQSALAIHPNDARPRGIGNGDTIRVFNDLGECICDAEITDKVRPGVVSLPKGLWSHHTRDGHTANALAPDSTADLGGGAAYNDARVEIQRLDDTRVRPAGSPSV